MTATTWTVVIDIEGDAGDTVATARLDDQTSEHLFGIGRAWIAPQDREVPGVGQEMAVARALSDLSHRIIGKAYADVERAEGSRR
ncbi:MAG: DUF1876 family protein [Pseudonocardia sp.]|nr:DUF1876 family protein [Pseudonocardia sp.]